ncbi:hypothetical protein [Ornithinimicrobium kibberense]|uniref:hypothetical protein n=1 Tax=Ornithinimicrobium kibberense TaxID=282060 RepID=UPI003616841B
MPSASGARFSPNRLMRVCRPHLGAAGVLQQPAQHHADATSSATDPRVPLKPRSSGPRHVRAAGCPRRPPSAGLTATRPTTGLRS